MIHTMIYLDTSVWDADTHSMAGKYRIQIHTAWLGNTGYRYTQRGWEIQDTGMQLHK